MMLIGRQIIVRASGLIALVIMFAVTGFSTSLCTTPSSLSTRSVALQLINGSTTRTICDANSGLDVNPHTGQVTYSGGVANWSLNVATGIGTPRHSVGVMDLNSVDTTSLGNPGTLTIKFSERMIQEYIPFFDLSFGLTIKNATVRYDVYYSNTDDYFATTTLIGSVGPFSTTTTQKAFNGHSFLRPASAETLPYSITQVLTITPVGSLANRTTHSFNGDAVLTPTFPITTTNTPEPSTLGLLSIGLVVAGIEMGRRRVSRKSNQ